MWVRMNFILTLTYILSISPKYQYTSVNLSRLLVLRPLSLEHYDQTQRFIRVLPGPPHLVTVSFLLQLFPLYLLHLMQTPFT